MLTCKAFRRTTAGESISIVWEEQIRPLNENLTKSESKTLLLSISTSHSHAERTDPGLTQQPCSHNLCFILSFCFLCDSCLLISVVYLKNPLWQVTWIINRFKCTCQRHCSMIHFSTNANANTPAWITVIIYNCHGNLPCLLNVYIARLSVSSSTTTKLVINVLISKLFVRHRLHCNCQQM